MKMYFLFPKPVFGGVKPGSLFEHLGISPLPEPETEIISVKELESRLRPDQRVDKDGQPFNLQYKVEQIESGPFQGFGASLTKWKKDASGKPLSTLERFDHCVEINRKADGSWFINHDFIRKFEGAGGDTGTGTPGALTVPVLHMQYPGRKKEFYLVFNLAYRTKILDLSALPKIKYGMWTMDFAGGFGDLINADKKNAAIELMEEMGLKVGESSIVKVGYGVHNRSDTANGNITNLVMVDVSELKNPNLAPPTDLISKDTRVAIPLSLCFPYVDQIVNDAILNAQYSLGAFEKMTPAEQAKALPKG